MLFTTTTHQQCSKCWRATHSCPPRHQPHHPNIWCQATPSPQPPRHTPLPQLQAAVDDELSRRPLELDPCGYFIVLLDREAQEIVVEWYTNTINKNGMCYLMGMDQQRTDTMMYAYSQEWRVIQKQDGQSRAHLGTMCEQWHASVCFLYLPTLKQVQASTISSCAGWQCQGGERGTARGAPSGAHVQSPGACQLPRYRGEHMLCQY